MNYLHIILAFLVFSSSVFAQVCPKDNRYSDSEYFSDQQIDANLDVIYGNAINYNKEAQDLKLDFYYPNTAIDPLEKRPFVLLIHGGGFVAGDKSRMTLYCKNLAKRGFVTATMSYRLGFNESQMIDIANAIYRAEQDAKAALRYVVAKADDYAIDTSWIFIGGSSAGALTSLYTAYGSQEEWISFNPAIESTLGPLNASGNSLDNEFAIQGIYNHAGNITPGIIANDALIPMISFHGEQDNVVPIDTGLFGAIGSRPLHKMLVDQGVCNDFSMDPEGGHIIYRGQQGNALIADRIACFFKSLMCNTCSDFYATEPTPSACAN